MEEERHRELSRFFNAARGEDELALLVEGLLNPRKSMELSSGSA